MKKKKIGRKWFDGKDEQTVLSKLETVWALDGTAREAALYADISEGALNRYLAMHPQIRERRDRLKEKPVLQARQSVVKGLEGDPDLALKYLKCKRSDEFSEKIKQEHSGEVAAVEISEEKYERIIKREAKRLKNSGAK